MRLAKQSRLFNHSLDAAVYYFGLQCSFREMRLSMLQYTMSQRRSMVRSGKHDLKNKSDIPDLNDVMNVLDTENPSEKSQALAFSPTDLSWDRGGQTIGKALSPLYTIARKLIDENKECICLIQVGGFYELYFEQASTIGPKLGIKVATRNALNHAVPMAGFPLKQLQKFVKILVHDLQLNVAIIDQYDHLNSDTDLKHRKISRIVSPGTLVDETFMNFSQNNYLVAISPGFKPGAHLDPSVLVGLLWVDISVGEFYVQQTTLGELADDLKRINPSEIILPKEYHISETHTDHFLATADLKKYFVRYHKTTYKDLKSHLKKNILLTRKLLESFTVREEAAMNLVLSYVNVNLPERKLVLEQPSRYLNENYLAMDSRTRDALELTGRSSFGSISVVGSLLNTIKRTKTASGSRLLSKWLLLPIVDEKTLERRLDFVSLFKNNVHLTTEIKNQLILLGDPVRSLQKLALRSGNALTHLQNIASGLAQLEQLKNTLKNASRSLKSEESALLKNFVREFHIPTGLSKKIFETIIVDIETTPESLSFGDNASSTPSLTNETSTPETPSTLAAESSIIFAVNKNHNTTLARLHAKLERFKTQESKIMRSFQLIATQIDPKSSVIHRERTGRHSDAIYVRCRAKFISKIEAQLIVEMNADIREKQKGCIIMKTIDWSDTIEKKNEIIREILDYEKKIVEEISAKVLAHIPTIRAASRCADFIDVTSSFGVLARENAWARPKFASTRILSVTSGRHAVVESSLKDNGKIFVPNDTKLGSDGNLWIVSGPNMGGKSTFLRQNALIVILAQIGCFVPAKRANVCIVDRLFTRIGASDDLFSDLSTFMVEMIETSNILRNATSRSLAIVDEIGRGTSGREGLAVAYATLLHLLEVNKCRTLFATHFGPELKNLLDEDKVNQKKIRFYKTHVRSLGGKHVFEHTLEPGISEKSYAIEVAKLAGFPKTALENAERALSLL